MLQVVLENVKDIYVISGDNVMVLGDLVAAFNIMRSSVYEYQDCVCVHI